MGIKRRPIRAHHLIQRRKKDTDRPLRFTKNNTHITLMIKALNALLLATLVVLASAMPSQASRVLLDDAAANATNFNQGSPDCIKADASTGLIEAAAGTADLSTLVAAIKAANLADAFNDTSSR